MLKRKWFKVSLVVLSILMVMVLVIGCTGKAAAPTTSVNTPTLFDRVNVLETQARANDTDKVKINARLDKIEAIEQSNSGSNNNQAIIDATNRSNDAVTKATDAQNRVANVENRLNTLPSTNNTAEIQNLQNELNTLKGNTVSKADYEALKNSTISKTDYDNKIAELTAKIVALTTTTSSSSSGTSTTSSADGLSVTVKDMGTEILAEEFGFNSDQSIKLTIKNSGSKDISDLRIYLYMQVEDYSLPLSYIDGSMSLGGDMSFSLTSSSSDEFTFRSNRISINAGKTKNYYLTPSVTIKKQSTYPYVGASGALSMTNTGTDVPYTNNPDYNVSKLKNDVTFDVSVEVIDYNID